MSTLGATALRCDVTEASSIAGAYSTIEQELGAPEVVIYNAGSGVFATFEQVSASDFELPWRVRDDEARADR